MLKGKGALITGSTQGLGYAMAARLAAEGCNVVLNGFGDGAEIERKRRRLEDSHGVRALHHGADLAEPRQIASLVDAAISGLGSVDILINNAVVRHFAPIETFRPEDWDKALAVNLSAAFHTARLVLPGMRAQFRPDRQHLLDLRPGRRGQSGRLRHHQDGANRLHPRRRPRDGRAGHHL
jgi:3-hydroxybutyrate dehydrogenase